MGALLKNHYFRKEIIPAFSSSEFFQGVKATDNWQDIEEYMLLKRGNNTVGASRTSIKKMDRATTGTPSFGYAGVFTLSGKLNDLLPQANVRVRTQLDPDMNLTKFSAAMDIAGISYSANGQVIDKSLYLAISKPNNISHKIVHLDKPITLSEFARSTLASKMDIKVGNTETMPVVNPLSGSVSGSLKVTVEGKETITVQEREVSAYKLVSDFNDIRTTMWVSKDGTTLKRQLVGNISMEKTDRETALKVVPTLDDQQSITDLDLSHFNDQSPQNGSTNAPGNTPELKLLEILMN